MAQAILEACVRGDAQTPIMIADAVSLPPLAPWEYNESLPRAVHPHVNTSVLDAAVRPCSSSLEQWNKLVNRDPLRVVVLGSSPLSGCGAAEAVDTPTKAGNSTVPSRRCDYTRSWGRRVRDCMQPALSTCCSGRDAQFKVRFKNAVSVGFFGECAAGRLLGPQTDVIILEAANVWNTNVRHLLHQLRRAAPRAVISFLIWPTKTVLGYALASRIPEAERGHASRQRLLQAAHAEQADVLDAADLMVRIYLSWGAASWGRHRRALSAANRNLFYAQRGFDTAHPSPAGHALVGAFVAHYIGGQLTQAHERWRAHAAEGAAPSALASVAASGGVEWHPPMDDASSSSATTTTWEQCYDEASELPVASAGGWTLKDEGSAAKAVVKMGWTSTKVGEKLALGPMPSPKPGRCSLVNARLNYLMSGYVRSAYLNGALFIRCLGCECSEMGGYYSQTQTPFPTVQTNASVASDPQLATLNASITASTQFLLLQPAATHGAVRCDIEVVHVAGRTHKGRRAEARPSKVQVNGLQLHSAMDAESAVLLFKRAWMTKNQGYRSFAIAALRCLRGTSAGSELLAALCTAEAREARQSKHPRRALDSNLTRTPEALRAIIRETIPISNNCTELLCELLAHGKVRAHMRDALGADASNHFGL